MARGSHAPFIQMLKNLERTVEKGLFQAIMIRGEVLEVMFSMQSDDNGNSVLYAK